MKKKGELNVKYHYCVDTIHNTAQEAFSKSSYCLPLSAPKRNEQMIDFRKTFVRRNTMPNPFRYHGADLQRKSTLSAR